MHEIPMDYRALVRLLRRVSVSSETGCWVSRGTITTQGYSQVVLSDRRRVQGHRLTFAMMRDEPLRPPHQLDHLCRIRACVNPWHLEQVTASENVRRGRLAEVTRSRRATHCKNGHERTPENLTSHRACKVCARASFREWRRQHPRGGC